MYLLPTRTGYTSMQDYALTVMECRNEVTQSTLKQCISNMQTLEMQLVNGVFSIDTLPARLDIEMRNLMNSSTGIGHHSKLASLFMQAKNGPSEFKAVVKALNKARKTMQMAYSSKFTAVNGVGDPSLDLIW